MNTAQLFEPDRRSKASVLFIICIVVLIGTIVLASQTQKGFGRIYLGAMLNAGLVTWMFVSSQVIAPIPI